MAHPTTPLLSLPLAILLSLTPPLLGNPAKVPQLSPLSVADSQAGFQIAPGFQITPAATEPALDEPVLAVWDGNGAMYVAEMRSYMQDTEGTATKTAHNGRIKRLEDRDGDGHYEHVTTFIDGLNLPRMILPLDHRIAVVETDSTAVTAYWDTDNDGVADQQKLLWEGKKHDPNRSVEHQDSGLLWNIDNNIYVSYGYRHYRFTNETWEKKSNNYIWSQWGLAHDQVGNLFYSTNSEPFFSGQILRHYWSLIPKNGGKLPKEPEPIKLGLPYRPTFTQVKNICPVDDRGRPQTDRRGMTSVCGQTVYQGSRFPESTQERFFIAEPTAHMIRQAWVMDEKGKRILVNAHGSDEFLLSPDPFFRPVNCHTGPDGALYVVDMARGIIQDAPWLNQNDRQFINESGFSAVKNRGRIWRITHQDHDGLAERPRMLDQPTTELVRHLGHPNGWWRMTAQKLLILRPDRQLAVPALTDIVKSNPNPLARLHALWTLEGMGENQLVLPYALHDSDWRVQAAAIRQHETTGDFSALAPLVLGRGSEKAAPQLYPEVLKQLILTLGFSTDPEHEKWLDRLVLQNPTHRGVILAGALALWQKDTPAIQALRSGQALAKIADTTERHEAHLAWQEAFSQWNRDLKVDSSLSKEDAQLVERGESLYFQNCVSCHAPDGCGTAIPNSDQLLAPNLTTSARVHGSAENLIPALLHGLIGPIDGKTYQAGIMPPLASLGITRDDHVAQLASYLRQAWQKKSPPIAPTKVQQLRKQHAQKTTPWTDSELKARSRSTLPLPHPK